MVSSLKKQTVVSMPPNHEYANEWSEHLDPPQGLFRQRDEFQNFSFYEKEQKLLSSQNFTKVLQQNLTVSNYIGHKIYHMLTVID